MFRWLRNLWNWVKGLGREAAKDAPIDIAISASVNTVMDHIKGAFKKKAEVNPRADVMQVLAQMGDDPAARTILSRLYVASQTGKPEKENDIMVALGDMLLRDNEGKVIIDKAKETYKWIGNMNSKDFASFAQGMKHDPFRQELQELLRSLPTYKEMQRQANRLLNEVARTASRPIGDLNEGLNGAWGARPLDWECHWFGRHLSGANALITNIVRATWNLWGIANFWTRIAILIIVTSPLVVALTSIAGSPTLTAITVLLPVFAIAGIFLWAVDPLVIPLLRKTPEIKETVEAAIKILKKIVAVEFLMGVYFTLVPIHSRPGFLAPILLVIVALLALWASELKWRWAWKGLVTALVVLTLLVVFPLRKERIDKEGVLPIVGKEISSFLFGPPKPPKPAPAQATVTPETPEFPRSGEGNATKDKPLKAWLDPLKTYTRGSRGMKYVFVENPSITFEDMEGGIGNNRETWWNKPAGRYFVYPLEADKATFRWWQ